MSAPETGSAPIATASEEHADEPDIRRRVLGGFGWSIVNVGTVQVSQIVVGLILVRLLSPRDYGLASMALVFSSLVLLISDFSMGTALVQRREITEADRSTVFWSTAAMGTILMLVGFAISVPLASFYHQPAVAPLFAVVSTSFLLVALQITPASVMLREMRYRVINLRGAAAAVMGNVVGITVALLGGGPWALILQQVATTGFGTALLWLYSKWRPRFILSRRSLRDLGGYGINLLGSNVLSYVKNNADNILVGRFLGSAALGTYAVAYNLMFLPLARLISPIQGTLFPVLSRWQDDLDRLANVWLRVVRLTTALLAPAMFGFIVVAPDFVPVIMGKKWHAAVPVLQLLAVVAFAQCIALLGERVLAAIDRTHVIFRFSVVECALTVAAFAVGLQWGIVGVALCYLAVSVPLQTAFIALTARSVRASVFAFAHSIRGVALATAVMVSGCLALRETLAQTHIGAPLRLVLVIAAGVLVYTAACSLLEPELMREIRRARSWRRGGEPVVATA
jgi:O-antigen/teichoic acid export membrane protein